MGPGNRPSSEFVSGSLRRDAGVISVAGRQDYDASEIAVVFQELALLPDLSVAENIHLPHRRDALGRIDDREMEATATEALEMIDPALVLSLRRPVSSLDLHQRQLVEVARALSSGAKLILLDEPTANLTFADAERLFSILRRLTNHGISILLVSHRMSEIRTVADVCTILRDGRSVVDRRALADISDQEIVQAMMGDVQQKGQTSAQAAKAKASDFSLSLAKGDTDLFLPTGSILGLAGAPDGPAGVINALTGADVAFRLVDRIGRSIPTVPLACRGRPKWGRLCLRRPRRKGGSGDAADSRQSGGGRAHRAQAVAGPAAGGSGSSLGVATPLD